MGDLVQLSDVLNPTFGKTKSGTTTEMTLKDRVVLCIQGARKTMMVAVNNANEP